MKVLFIGNDRDMAFMTCRILKRNGYEASAAVGKHEAVQALDSTAFDLAVMDYETVAAERTELISKIKGASGEPSLLMVSESREDEIPCFEAGADDWVQKPYKMEVLLARMAALTRQRRN